MVLEEAADFRMAIEYRTGGQAQVRLSGELDIASLGGARQALYALLKDRARVAVDLRELRFLDLPALRLLVEIAAAAAARDCPLELRGAQGQVARVIELTKVGALLPLMA